MQGRRARVHCNCMPRSGVTGEVLFEALHFGTARDPSRTKAVHYFVDFLFTDEWKTIWEKLAAHFRAPSIIRRKAGGIRKASGLAYNVRRRCGGRGCRAEL